MLTPIVREQSRDDRRDLFFAGLSFVVHRESFIQEFRIEMSCDERGTLEQFLMEWDGRRQP